jgi:serine beta-lactamase-like protein LACTB
MMGPRQRLTLPMRTIHALIAGVLLSVATSPSLESQESQRFADTLPDSLSRRVDSTVSALMSAKHVPALSLAIGLGNRLIFSRAYGLADLENSVPATTTSVFRTASIGKPMTATAVLQLWQERKLDLDAPIQKYCPAFPLKRWPVTARELLWHASGIRDKTAAEESNYTHYESIAAALAPFASDSLIFEPGTAFHYTSYGYDVLGCAIEGASGEPYMDYMRRGIFRAAGMTHTQLDDVKELISQRARGYVLDRNAKVINAIHDDMSNRVPAGGFVSTPTDLVMFAQAYLQGKLVADSTRQLMLRRPNIGGIAPSSDTFYGFGWAISDWYGVQEVSHGGGTPGVTAILYMLPAKGYAVAVMMNLEGVPDRGDLAGDIAKIVLGPRAPHR